MLMITQRVPFPSHPRGLYWVVQLEKEEGWRGNSIWGNKYFFDIGEEEILFPKQG